MPKSAPWSSLSISLFRAAMGQIASSRADLVFVEHPGFENVAGRVKLNEFTFGPAVGWQLYDPHDLLVNNRVGPQYWVGTLQPSPPTNFYSVPEGNPVAILFNYFGSGNQGPNPCVPPSTWGRQADVEGVRGSALTIRRQPTTWPFIASRPNLPTIIWKMGGFLVAREVQPRAYG